MQGHGWWAAMSATIMGCAVVAGSAQATAPEGSDPPQIVTIDAAARATPFPHFWEQMFGSGRAAVTLRQSYRDDMKAVKAITDFNYVRFHAIFHDELGVYDEDKKGNPVYNFQMVDQMYDGLLAQHVRPFVELSFMPKKLASDPAALHNFWYKQNVSPPKDYAKWDAFMKAFVQHLVDRYGLDEVSQWYFEVWNEPNIDFWVGNPKQATYFELYDHTARDVKAVSERLRVGGPSSARAGWVGDMIAHAAAEHVPLDFVSSHIYGTDKVMYVLGAGSTEVVTKEDMVCRGVRKMHDDIAGSTMPKLPLIVSEFNVRSGFNEALDGPYVGPAIANIIRECDGLTEMMSFWTLSDVFEEQGPAKVPMHGGFGLIATDGIPKPSFVAFELLHKLGEERIANSADDVLVTRQKDGKLMLAVWNLTPFGGVGQTRKVQLSLTHSGAREASISRVDATHSDAQAAFQAMGSPQYPGPAQIEALRGAAKLTVPEIRPLRHGVLDLELPPNSLFLVEPR